MLLVRGACSLGAARPLPHLGSRPKLSSGLVTSATRKPRRGSTSGPRHLVTPSLAAAEGGRWANLWQGIQQGLGRSGPRTKEMRQTWWSEDTVAVVTGANKGIGYEIALALAREGVTCVLTARDPEKGQAAADRISKEVGREVAFCKLDITHREDCERLAEVLYKQYGKIDLLVNNAGFAYKGSVFGAHEAEKTIETNVYGTMNVCETLKPLLNTSSPHKARVVNVCSMAGKLKIVQEPLRSHFSCAASMDEVLVLMREFVAAVERGSHSRDGWPNSMYGVSKLGEATYTRVLARELEPLGVMVNACCPGWCATDMSSWRGPKTAAQGADTPVYLALAPPDFPTGTFFAERQRQPF